MWLPSGGDTVTRNVDSRFQLLDSQFFPKQDKLRHCNVLTIANLEFFFDVHFHLYSISYAVYAKKSMFSRECFDLTVKYMIVIMTI